MKLFKNVVEFGKKNWKTGLVLVTGAAIGVAAKALLGGEGLSDEDLEDELEDLEEIETDEEVDSKD